MKALARIKTTYRRAGYVSMFAIVVAKLRRVGKGADASARSAARWQAPRCVHVPVLGFPRGPRCAQPTLRDSL